MRCGLLLFLALSALGLSEAVAIAAPAGVIYFGTTSQSKPFKLNVAPEGVRFRIDWSADCKDNGKPFQAQTASQRPLALQGGAFSSHEAYDATASDGARVHYEIRMAGALRRGGRASGTWDAVASGPYKGGGTYRCDTGPVTWSARRSG